MQHKVYSQKEMDAILRGEDMQHKFEPFERVLVRDKETQKWRCNFYSHSEIREDGREFYICPASYFSQCIPYEGNEHLLGTTDSPEPKHEFKWGDKIEVWRNDKWVKGLYGFKEYEEDGDYTMCHRVYLFGSTPLVDIAKIRPMKQ